MPDPTQWVIDTNIYTHFCRAGHADVLRDLAPGGIIIVPDAVGVEIRQGQETYPGIPGVPDTPWATLAVLTEEEETTELLVKAAMGGGPSDHLGECAVIACAEHRQLTALLDERAAIAQADLRGVPSHDTIWLVIEAYYVLFDQDKVPVIKIVDDLLATDMWLPVDSGESLFTFAYRAGYLPRP